MAPVRQACGHFIMALTSSRKLAVLFPSSVGLRQNPLNILPARKKNKKTDKTLTGNQNAQTKESKVRHAKDKTGPEVPASLTNCLRTTSISSIDLLTGYFEPRVKTIHSGHRFLSAPCILKHLIKHLRLTGSYYNRSSINAIHQRDVAGFTHLALCHVIFTVSF